MQNIFISLPNFASLSCSDEFEEILILGLLQYLAQYMHYLTTINWELFSLSFKHYKAQRAKNRRKNIF